MEIKVIMQTNSDMTRIQNLRFASPPPCPFLS